MDDEDDDGGRSRKSLEEPLVGEDESVSSPEDGWSPSDAEPWPARHSELEKLGQPSD